MPFAFPASNAPRPPKDPEKNLFPNDKMSKCNSITPVTTATTSHYSVEEIINVDLIVVCSGLNAPGEARVTPPPETGKGTPINQG